jgi:LmbE family N-acetylglucosaminyl deacetylase
VLRPRRGRVLLLAPHPDDDVLGAGGTCALHAQQGDPVHVLVAYDGLEGDPERRWTREELRLLRQRECRAGGAHLGLRDYEFWEYPEGHAPAPEQLLAAARRIAAKLRELRIDTLYAPWIGEHHLDHHVLARAARLGAVLAGFGGAALGYEVWTPLVPTLVVDISSVFERKVAALKEHRSQIAYRDILHKGLALSAQRAMYLAPEARHGEGFRPLGPPSGADGVLLTGG